MSVVREIEAQDLASLLSSGEEVELIDVRTPSEAARGVIPNAENLPLHLLPQEAERVARAPKVVFYCRSGARSAQACMFLGMQGHRDVYNLRGGIISWVRSGLPVADLGQ
jgi:rhodanese-related sulfurtransferase